MEKKPDEARREFESAQAAAPRLTAAYINLGVLELEVDNLDMARREFAKALSTHFDSPEALNNMALLESRRGLSPEVVEKFGRAAEEGGHREQTLTNLGYLQLTGRPVGGGGRNFPEGPRDGPRLLSRPEQPWSHSPAQG